MKTLAMTTTTLVLGLGLGTGCGDDSEPACEPTEGTICTIVGNGEHGYSGEGGPALEARMSMPMDTLAAPDGDVFVIDWNNHRIRRLSPDGILHFVVGNGELGGSLEDPPDSALNHPTDLLLDATGTRLYVAAWHNSKVLRLNPETGDILDTCGDGRRAYFGDDGPALTSSLDLPASIALSPTGDLAIMDQANQVIRFLDANGNIGLLAGQCVIDKPVERGGPGPCAQPVKCPAPSGKWTCGDPATTCGEPCWPGYNGDDIPVAQMRMAQEYGQSADPGGKLLYDPQGNLYFADVSNHMIRMIDTDGMVRRIAGVPPAPGEQARGGYSGDGGPAVEAKLNHPVDLALADDGTLFFSDVFNHCIRAISPDGIIRTVAGVCGEKGFDGDGGPPELALMSRPYGVEWAPPNRLYITDTGNARIRLLLLE